MRLRHIFGGALHLSLPLAVPASAQKGRGEQVSVDSRALEGNLLGDSPDRAVSIVLPPGYTREPQKRYPVVYLLHGLTTNNTVWLGLGYVAGLDAPSIADRLMDSGRIQPMILVMPDASNAYGGSFYTDSSGSGSWEEFIVRELVSYVDAHYLTLARAGSRAKAGHAMEGCRALVLAMKHPESHAVVSSMSPYYAGFVDTEASQYLSPAAFDLTSGYLKLRDTNASLAEITELAMAAAFSPDPGNPRTASTSFCTVASPSTWGRMKTREAARAYDAALTRAGVPRVFTRYQGDHANRVAERFTTIVLPFVSRNLAGD